MCAEESWAFSFGSRELEEGMFGWVKLVVDQYKVQEECVGAEEYWMFCSVAEIWRRHVQMDGLS